MTGLSPEILQQITKNGLSAIQFHGRFKIVGGRLFYPCERPSDEWIGHGYFTTRPLDLKDHHAIPAPVAKKRWLHKKTGKTIHSKPPDDLGLHYSALIVVLELFIWLDTVYGLRKYASLIQSEQRPSKRTVQRWFQRAIIAPERFQTAVRRHMSSSCEPRPLERYLTGGYDPPGAHPRKAWKDPEKVNRLHRGLTMLLIASKTANKPTSMTLAETRRQGEHEPFLLD